MEHRLVLAVALLGLLAAGCGGRTLGGEGNHTPDSEVEPVDAGPDASTGSPIVFVREQGSAPGLHAIRPDGSGLIHLSGELAQGATVDGYAMSAQGGVFREIQGTETVTYHVIRSDGSAIYTSPRWDWQPNLGDLGLTGRGRVAWLFADDTLLLVDLLTDEISSFSTPLLLAVDLFGDWAIGAAPANGFLTVRALALSDGGATYLAEFSQSQQALHDWVFDEARGTVYVGVGQQDVWALRLDGSEAFCLTDGTSTVTGRPAGLIQETGELVVWSPEQVAVIDPETGSARWQTFPSDTVDQFALARDGSWFADVRFREDLSAYVHITEHLDAVNQDRYELELGEFIAEPWNCCCGGPAVAPLALSSRSGRLAVPIEYRFGMCACACMEEPPPPEETPLDLVLIDVHRIPSVRPLSHNSACAPAFSPDGARVAFCDNELHILPMAGGYLRSGISVYDLDADTTTTITDETQFDTRLHWVE